LRQTQSILLIAIDSIIPVRGKALAGFDEFCAALDHNGIPAVWVTSRSRLQIDEPRRRFGHASPFIAEDGCGVYLPEDYFHLKPTNKTVRLGRFTTIPIAQLLPAAKEALASLSEETGVEVVPLRSLSPRELTQNTGLPQRDAELSRQRDFDELFFFAGANEADITQFQNVAAEKKVALRQHGVMWSAAVSASLRQCVSDLTKLYERALRSHPSIIGIAGTNEAGALLPLCDRGIVLARQAELETAAQKHTKARILGMFAEDVWEQILEAVSIKR
jgi:predicted mannosyl-3-phosphoglycerate phosphatase (HAD superfamily)